MSEYECSNPVAELTNTYCLMQYAISDNYITGEEMDCIIRTLSSEYTEHPAFGPVLTQFVVEIANSMSGDSFSIDCNLESSHLGFDQLARERFTRFYDQFAAENRPANCQENSPIYSFFLGRYDDIRCYLNIHHDPWVRGFPN